MNRETELKKIDVYVGYCHSTFRVYVSFVFGMLVAIGVSLMGLKLQNKIDMLSYYVVLLGLCAPFFAFFVLYGYRSYRKSLNKVDSMLERVNNGEELPSIEDMIKGKGI